ncbi:MAG: ABC transporter permease subunit [Chloroflexi bacterium]|nr:ABC transporter permease subunit [Chloroflexota bacterium]
MAQPPPSTPQTHERIPFWRDGRVIGVLAQVIFVSLVLLAAAWLLGNVSRNIGALGSFRCPDGTDSFRCGFLFLRIDAQFDIAESVISYTPSDPYARALLVGALNTVKVAFFGIIFATILGTLTGIARLSRNWLVSNLAKWYVDFFRNTPLLLQLIFIYFGVILLLPNIRQALQPFGLPIYLSQRGINLPGPVFMPSFRVWLFFLLGGLVAAGVVSLLLARREQQVERSLNRTAWALLAFGVVAGSGWFVANAAISSQAMLLSEALPAAEFEQIAGIVAERLGVADLAEVETAVTNGVLTPEQVNEASLTICAVRDAPSETNLTAQLRANNVPYSLNRSNRLDQAARAFAAGDCDVLVAAEADLLAVQATLDGTYRLLPIAEAPIRLSIPRLEGLNFQGGVKLTPSFAALLIGLTLYTGAFIAEIVRAGIQSVPKGQSEAARALGLSESQRLRLVVLPQALRVIIPPLTSQYLNLTKNSSLAIAVGFADLWAISYTTLNQSGRSVQVFMIVMAAYLSFSLSISFLLNLYNRRIALVER